ncbi:methylenetetrahydrofolate reductase [Leuconostocaceae bacterium ESL0958]|nr:methylenetetrahydrofolate reductase [Leuconostocaceae bacterium ESL0958]
MASILENYQAGGAAVQSIELTRTNWPALSASHPAVAYYSLVNQGQTVRDWQTLQQLAGQIQDRSQKAVLLHFRARQTRPAQLPGICRDLAANKIDNLLVIAGDRAGLANGYAGALPALADLKAKAPQLTLAAAIDLNAIARVGLATVLEEALAKEAAGAGVLITQVFFDPSLYFRLQQALQQAGSQLRLIAGIYLAQGAEDYHFVEQVLHLVLPAAFLANPKAATDQLLATLRAGGVTGLHYFASPAQPALLTEALG